MQPAGAEAAYLSDNTATESEWMCTHVDWQGFSVTVCFTCLVDEEGSASLSVPHYVLTILGRTSKLPGESAEGEMTAATIGRCNVWFKFPSVSNWFIPLYGFNFGKYRAAGFLQVV